MTKTKVIQKKIEGRRDKNQNCKEKNKDRYEKNRGCQEKLKTKVMRKIKPRYNKIKVAKKKN